MNIYIHDRPFFWLENHQTPETYLGQAPSRRSLANLREVTDPGAYALLEEQQIRDFQPIIESLNSEEWAGIAWAPLDMGRAFQDFLSFFKKVNAAGGIVRKGQKILFIKRFGLWDMPKGKLEPGENSQENALREVQEECCIEVEVEGFVGSTWHTYTMNGIPVIKQTDWYAMRCLSDENLCPQKEEGIEECRYFSFKNLAEPKSNTFRSIAHIIELYQAEFQNPS